MYIGTSIFLIAVGAILRYARSHAADLIARDAEIGVFAALLGVVYMIALVVGPLRYR